MQPFDASNSCSIDEVKATGYPKTQFSMYVVKILPTLPVTNRVSQCKMTNLKSWLR